MIRRLAMLLACALVAALFAIPAAADENAEMMPEMGPPPEMQDLAFLEGVWDVQMNMKMDPADTVFVKSTGVMTCRYVAGGAAMLSEFEGSMPDMVVHGISLQCFDRATNLWQVTWTDDMASRITLLTGERKGSGSVMQGPDRFGDMSFLSRVTTSNETATSFDWKYEMSTDNGKTWVEAGHAKYTKRK